MQFTCNSCGLAFPSTEDQRFHMKSEWHRYNLKRRVAQLPAISEDLFNSKVANIKKEEADKEAAIKGKIRGRKGGKTEDDVERTVTKKEQRRREKETLAEKKRQLLELARQSMAEGIKRDNAEKYNESTEIPAEIEEKEEEVVKIETNLSEEESNEVFEEKLLQDKLKNAVTIEPNYCLFCNNKKFANQEQAIKHMFKSHGLYIPEQKYLIDREGLIAYLAEKIGLGNICLVCNYQGRSLEAVRAHMLSKMHCKIPYESENERMEISEFYDFSSTYNDHDDIIETVTVTGDAEGEEDWEDMEEEDISDEEDDALPQDLALVNGYELHLPSGVVVGHRALARYYRQNLPPDRVLSEGQGTVIAAESRHMVSLGDKKELASQKRIWAREKKAEDVNDRRAAKFINNQPYYRDQLLQ